MTAIIRTVGRVFVSLESLFVIGMIAFFLIVPFEGYRRFTAEKQWTEDLKTVLEMDRLYTQSQSLFYQMIHDVYDVRDVLLSQGIDESVLIPQSSEVGFFYLTQKERVVIARYEDALQGRFMLDGELIQPNGSNGQEPWPQGRRPEEVFGAGVWLINQRGSVISEMVRDIQFFADQSDPISSWDRWHATITNHRDLSQPLKVHLLEYLEAFHPDRTLFVNDSHWRTSASIASQIERIIVQPGTTRLPDFSPPHSTFNAEGKVTLSHLELPKTVHALSRYAFHEDFFDIDTLIIRNTTTFEAQQETFSSVRNLVSFLHDANLGVPNVSHLVNPILETSGDVSYVTDQVALHYSFDRITIQVTGRIVTLLFYDEDTLVAYARNVKIVRYFLALEDTLPFYVETVIANRFRHVQPPIKPDYRFLGWYLDPNRIDMRLYHQDPLPGFLVEVFARYQRIADIPAPPPFS